MKKNGWLLMVLASVLLLYVFISFFSFNDTVEVNMQKTISVRMKEIVVPNQHSFELQMNEQIKKVKTMAAILAENGELGDATQVDLLRIAVRNNGLVRCTIAFPDGHIVTQDNQNDRNVSNELFFQKGMQGETFINAFVPGVVDKSENVLLFTAPIQKGNNVIGTLTYSFLSAEIEQMFDFRFLEGEGEMLIIRKNGDILIGCPTHLPSDGNILEYIRANCLHIGHTASSCVDLVKANGLTDATFKVTAEKLYIQYTQLDFGDWYMLFLAPESAVRKTIYVVANEQKKFSVALGTCILIYIAAVLLLWMSRRTNVDKMTGAPTFDCFKKKAKRKIKSHPALIMIQLDVKDLKLINRIYDFSTGDRVIKNIALALEKTLHDLDALYARVGVDDFVMLLPFSDYETLYRLRSRFIAAFRELMGTAFTTTVEFPTGQYLITDADAEKPNVPEIYEKVNFAHRTAKQGNMSRVVDYQETLEKQAMFEKSIEDRMEDALKRGEFHLYLQPKYRVADETLCGAEALVRWITDDGKTILYPMDFIPVFERNGFIVKMDHYIYESAVQKIREQMDEGLKPVVISVNFSRHHLNNEHFVEELCAIADNYAVPHSYLEIELTESIFFDNKESMISLLDALHKQHFTLSMDDFGSGYSSLGLLKDLAVDVLKIDKGFFAYAQDTRRVGIVVSNIVRMAKELGIQTVAEGVETREHVDMLRELGCDVIQGYYFARPMPAESFSSGKQVLQQNLHTNCY